MGGVLDLVDNILGSLRKGVLTRSHLANFCQYYSFVSSLEPLKVEKSLQDVDWVMAMQEELNNFERKSSVYLSGETQYQCHWHQVGFPQQAR